MNIPQNVGPTFHPIYLPYSPLIFFFFFLLQWANLIGPSLKKKWNYGGSPKKKGSILKYRVPILWLTYIGERRTIFAKAYGVKVRCYWECFEEHVRNLGTLCFDPPPQDKKERSLHSTTWLLIVCIEISNAKIGSTIFGLD